MVWACDDLRGKKISKSGYENEHRRKKRKTTKETVGYDRELYEDCWCVRKECEKLRQLEV